MKILVVGDGARENALAKSLSSHKVFALSSYINPGIKEVVDSTQGEYFLGEITPEEVRKIISRINPDMGVIGPEDPLFRGVSDEFRKEGIPVFGASKKNARIEESKVWARWLMWKYEIPGRLRYKAFSTMEEAAKFISEYGGSLAVKPAGQAGGKGVKVIADIQAYLSRDKRQAMAKSVNEIGSYYNKEGEPKIIVEEKVDGPEYTLHALSDGSTILPLPLAQDYKNAYQDGIGPETGGMGSISGPGFLLPFINQEEYDGTFDIVRKTVSAVEKETGESYTGAIAGQMMLTGLWGPTVIEYYSRFGDPEASAIIPRIQDFGDLIERTATGHLSNAKLRVDERPSLVWAVSPLGYPLDRKLASGHKVSIDVPKIREIGCDVFFGSIALEENSLVTKGSRALELVCLGDFEESRRKLMKSLSFIESDVKLIYRNDIGSTILEQEEKAEIVRYTYTSRKKRGTLGVSADWSPNGGLW
ncbi:Phosphoribosylamine--glycine ligase [Sulfuracidifex tepidarius]|uniref:phosphoribosylamine--glycine ligase n=1 Tax=Sulfuracidifex tepidarius TaxID=1294262 RepID=A0A510DUZ8_9CREN|nr:phosphoribosylamine--glycine ligase [Sulfuracidifex tepidarius]BBG24053.1 Phosphoribosylamine--glycine ligase [Sulfuracidifex tepidarius]